MRFVTHPFCGISANGTEDKTDDDAGRGGEDQIGKISFLKNFHFCFSAALGTMLLGKDFFHE